MSATIVGIDPGEVIGWCMYSRATCKPVRFGEVECADALGESLRSFAAGASEGITYVIERPKVYGGIARPDVGETCVQFGRLYELIRLATGAAPEWMTRIDVRKTLGDAVHGVFAVRTDATAWQALKTTHGGDKADKKGGPLYGVKGHARAALAVAVAWSLTNGAKILANRA